MAAQLATQNWSGKISTLAIGSAGQEIKIGGEESLPFLFSEGALPNRPRIAFEIWDVAPEDWPQELTRHYGKALADPLEWAKKCVDDYKAQLLCLKLQGTHPDCGDRDAASSAKLVSRLLEKVDVPLIISGCGDDAKDNLVLPAVCEAAKGRCCLIGSASQDNYKTLAAAAMADGHSIIAESPIDINIAKQLNILLSDMGLPFERIAINPTIGALGYGLEYAYSIMERVRLAALSGDKAVACPFICFVGQEAWRAKEAKDGGPRQGILWEAVTASALIQAGADLLVMRHPEAAEKVNKYIEDLMTQ
ncbi:MAG: acetyl-CoA decarbonylase/synthase complex subunit delta [Candidatus Omnitrophota bacterium]